MKGVSHSMWCGGLFWSRPLSGWQLSVTIPWRTHRLLLCQLPSLLASMFGSLTSVFAILINRFLPLGFYMFRYLFQGRILWRGLFFVQWTFCCNVSLNFTYFRHRPLGQLTIWCRVLGIPIPAFGPAYCLELGCLTVRWSFEVWENSSW